MSNYKCHEELENVYNQSDLVYMFPNRPSPSEMTKTPVPHDPRTVDLFKMIEQADDTSDMQSIHRCSSQLPNQQVMMGPDSQNPITGLGIHLMGLVHKMLTEGEDIPIHMLTAVLRFATGRAQSETSFAEKRLTFKLWTAAKPILTNTDNEQVDKQILETYSKKYIEDLETNESK